MRAPSLFLPGFAALHLLSAPASGLPVTLYDGSSSPVEQGWTRVYGEGTVTVGDGTTRFTTTQVPGARTSPWDTFVFNTEATDFVVSIRLQVDSANYNFLDASLTFSPFGKDTPLSHDRFNNLTIANNILLWGDEAGGSYVLDTSVFHEYALRYLDGNLDVYVDAPFSDIVAGTAVPVLSRANPVPQGGTVPGVIVFGDATNDPNYNSNYVVDFVTIDNYAAVPEPSAALLLLSGLCAPLFQRRRRVS